MNLLEKTEQLFHSARISLIEAAAALYEVQTTEVWKEKTDSWGEYVATLGISQTAASKYINVIEHYKTFSLAKMGEVELEKLYLAKSLEGTPEEHFEKALVLSRAELKEQKVFEDTGEEHLHSYICRICHIQLS